MALGWISKHANSKLFDKGSIGGGLTKALILAGGYGTRLKDLTKHTPKPLIKIGGKSVLGHIVDRLREHGIAEIIIKTHYLPEKIMLGIGDKALYYYEPVLFNWKETLSHLSSWMNDDFFVINGDTISEVDYTDMMAFHLKGGNKITVLMDDWRCAGTWIYSSAYFTEKNLQVRPYRPSVAWFDIGTPERLEAAKKHFEQGERQLCP